MVMSRAHEESATKSKRIRDAMSKKQALARDEKKPMQATVPMWLELDKANKSFKVLPARADLVRRVFALAIEGYGKSTIAKMLNADGKQSFKGKTWGASSVDKILSNRAVLGEYQPHSVQGSEDGARKPVGDPIANYYPRIISDEEWSRARGAIDARLTGGGGTKQSEAFQIWQSIGKCVLCGAAMHKTNKGKPPKGGSYLECFKAKKGLCDAKLVRLDHCEQVFRAILARLGAQELVRGSADEQQLQLLGVEGRLSERRSWLQQAWLALDGPPSKLLEAKIKEAEAKIEELEAEKAALQATIATVSTASAGFDEFIRTVDLETKQGRRRANTLLVQLKVVVYMSKQLGYAVCREGRVLFGAAWKDGQAGYLGTVWQLRNEGKDMRTMAYEALMRMAVGAFTPATEAALLADADVEEAVEADEWQVLQAPALGITEQLVPEDVDYSGALADGKTRKSSSKSSSS
jgi:hypothetical protein